VFWVEGRKGEIDTFTHTHTHTHTHHIYSSTFPLLPSLETHLKILIRLILSRIA